MGVLDREFAEKNVLSPLKKRDNFAVLDTSTTDDARMNSILNLDEVVDPKKTLGQCS